jgi:hypothetical protein
MGFPPQNGRYVFFSSCKQVTRVRYTRSFCTPKGRNPWGVESGDPAGYVTGPPLPIHLAGNVVSRNCLTGEPQCGGASSCWKVEVPWNGERWGTKTFWVAVLCGENRILLAMFIYSTKVCALLLGHSVHTKFHNDWFSHSKIDRHTDTKTAWWPYDPIFIYSKQVK